MKKVLIFIFTAVFCCLPLVGCNEDAGGGVKDFVADEMHCVVSLPQDYDVFYEAEVRDTQSMFDKDLYNAETVSGKPKKEGYRYYNMLRNVPFKILTPLGVIQNKNADGQTLVYWKLNDTLYKDGDNYNSATTFKCAKDTEISPVYCDFRPVGMLMYEGGCDGLTVVPVGEIFDGDGNIREREGVYYLYGVYFFEPEREFWRTNLTLKKYVINYTVKYVAENYSKDFYTINVEIEKGKLFDRGNVIVETLYKIEGHGFMTYGSKHVINDDFTGAIYSLPIGEHELKYTFV